MRMRSLLGWVSAATIALTIGLLSAGPAQAETFSYGIGYDVVNNGNVCTSACQLGRPGDGAGELSGPAGVAASGDELFAVEPDNSRVSVFNATTGAFVRALGTDVGGSNVDICTTSCAVGLPIGGGSVGFATAVAVSGGRLFTAGDSQRVTIRNATTGVFERAFGKNVGGPGVNTCTSDCALFGATFGSDAGALGNPGALAVVGNEVFVLEASNRRVSVFDATTGAFIRALGKNVGPGSARVCTISTTCQAAALPGSAAGDLRQVGGLAVANNEVFISDAGNNRVAILDATTGVWKGAIGTSVGGPGVDICTDPCAVGAIGIGAGDLYVVRMLSIAGNELLVSEQQNNRVSVFNATTHVFVRALGNDVGGAGVDVCTTICQAGTANAPGDMFQPTSFSVAIAAGKLAIGEYTPALLGRATARLLLRDATTGTFVRAFGKSVQPGGGTESEKCTTVCQAGRKGNAAGRLDTPLGAAVAGASLFVADAFNFRIAVYDAASGAFVRALGKGVGGSGTTACTTTCGTGNPDSVDPGVSGFLYGPAGPAVADGKVFVAELGNARVSAVDATTGAFVRGYGKDVGGGGTTTCTGLCTGGTPGSGAGQLESPQGVAVADGRLFVAEPANNRVSVFDVGSGAFVRAFGKNVGGVTDTCTVVCQRGSSGGTAGALTEPVGLAVAGGEVFVAEAAGRRVSVFDAATGAFKRALGKYVGGDHTALCTSVCETGSAGPGGGRLDRPNAVAVNAGEVFVPESINSRVSVLDATTGAFKRAFGKNVGGSGIDTCTTACQAGYSGGGAAQFDTANGVVVSGSTVFVTDTNNDRVQAFALGLPPATVIDRASVTDAFSPAASMPAMPAAPKATTAAPKATIRVARLSLSAALRRGILVRVTGIASRRAKVIARKGAKTVARGSATVAGDGTAMVRVRFTRSAKRSLRRARSVKLRVSGGGAATVVTVRRGG